jgi:formate hydrogenlyase subunit 6/NADH:ubiquinone oxidoreductase subunit I
MEFHTALVTLVVIGHITDEASPLRRLLLKGYAWREVDLLKVLFRVSNLSIMKRAWFRKPFYYLFAHFLGTRGVVCQATTLAETMAFIDGLPDEYDLAVGPCRCRVGNKNCDHEIMADIVIRRTAPIWYKELFPKDYRVITKQEAKEICRTSRKAGMIQSIDRHLYYRGSENYFVVCNCCKESCVPIIAYRMFKDEPYAFYPSRSVATMDEKKCAGCGTCIDACPFEERTLVTADVPAKRSGGRSVARVLNCQGCGLCADVCAAQATFMIPREDSPLRDVKPW